MTAPRPSHPDDIEPIARLPEEWQRALGGSARYRGEQVFRWMWGRGVLDPADMSDLPKDLRARLVASGLAAPAAVDHVHRSADGSRKLLLRLGDGAAIETVLLPLVRGRELLDADASAVDEDEPVADAGRELDAPTVRVTQCVSTQVGCAMACAFCASGLAGLKRHMSAGEIAMQALLGRAACEPGESLRNIVFMGMGEPLHNYDATARAIALLTHPNGFGLARRRITVSTSGLVPEIARLGDDFGGEVGLAISLHSAIDDRRSELVPVNRRHGLAALVSALGAYPLPRRRRITIEYTLIDGVNDAQDDVRALVSLLRGLRGRVKVNLIPMNPIVGSSLAPSPLTRVLAFQRTLVDAGHGCFVRRRRGDDVAAACGQLALAGAEPRPRRRPLPLARPGAGPRRPA